MISNPRFQTKRNKNHPNKNNYNNSRYRRAAISSHRLRRRFATKGELNADRGTRAYAHGTTRARKTGISCSPRGKRNKEGRMGRGEGGWPTRAAHGTQAGYTRIKGGVAMP